ncbi:unnamed protein product [Urochloa humidicola]
MSEAAVGNKAAAEPNPAAKVKGNAKTKRVAGKPKPKVVAIKTEMLCDDYVQWLRKNPIKRLKPLSESFFKRIPKEPESFTATSAMINKIVDVNEDILNQYDEKGYAIVGVEVLDNGRTRLCSLSEEEKAAAAAMIINKS